MALTVQSHNKVNSINGAMSSKMDDQIYSKKAIKASYDTRSYNYTVKIKDENGNDYTIMYF